MEQLNSKERVKLALEHKETDRIPVSLGFGLNEPVRRKLIAYLNVKNIRDVNEYLLRFSDIRKIRPEYIGPKDRNITLKDGKTVDYWGIKRKPISYGEGHYDEIEEYQLGRVEDVSDLNDYQWPSADWWDMDSLNDKINFLNSENYYAIQLDVYILFETSWYLRGFEQFFMDLVINPDLAWGILSHVTDYYIDFYRKALGSVDGKVDIVFGGDDLGQQQGLLMSLDLWEKMIKPHHERLNKVLHEYGVKVMYHSDGAIMEVIPGLIDMGIDILEALQFDANGMDPKKMKSLYGDKLCFHGGVSVQSTLPHGSQDEVREEVKERIKVLGKSGGYVIAPSHAVQAGTPPENVVAFLEETRNIIN